MCLFVYIARYTLLFTMLAFATMLYYQVPLLQVHDELFQLAVAATIIAVIGNLMVYITVSVHCWLLY